MSTEKPKKPRSGTKKRATPPAASGNVAEVLAAPDGAVLAVAIEAIERNPAYQARVAVDAEVVEEYAGAVRDAGTGPFPFPPVEVARVGGRLVLTDGWHRVAAVLQADGNIIPARVTDRTEAEMLRACLGANATHGLRRTQEDKRRAVLLALTDPELAKLASRPLGDLCGVSHAFVSGVRRGMGVEVGEVLTDVKIRRAEDRPSADYDPDWTAAAKWERRQIAAASWASDVDALAATVGTYNTSGWVSRRQAELADGDAVCEPGEQPEAVLARLEQTIQTVDDLKRAARAKGLPAQVAAVVVNWLAASVKVETTAEPWEAKTAAASAPKWLGAILTARVVERFPPKAPEADEQMTVWSIVRRGTDEQVRALGDDAAHSAFRNAFGVAPQETDLERAGYVLGLLAERPHSRCADARCAHLGGIILEGNTEVRGCVRCSRTPERAQARQDEMVEHVVELLRLGVSLPGLALVPPPLAAPASAASQIIEVEAL